MNSIININFIYRKISVITFLSNRGEFMDRRTLLKAACLTVLTPPQTPGPFYPRTRVSDQNADLVQIDGRSREAEGVKIFISGRVIDQDCRPVSGALVDLWQACHTGRYNHPADPNKAPLDPHFQYSA